MSGLEACSNAELIAINLRLEERIARLEKRNAELAADMVSEAVDAVLTGNETLARRVVERDADVDREEVEVEAEVIRLMALFQPVGIDLRTLCTVLKVNNDLERIADCAVNVAQRARGVESEARPAGIRRLRQLCDPVQCILQEAVQAYGAEDMEVARKVLHDDEAIDAVYAQAVRHTVAELGNGERSSAALIATLLIAKNLERIADHATNIAEDVIFLATGRIVRHEPNPTAAPDEHAG